ncbi:MAG: PilW family protein [Gammaproteobacteria bacterium]|nr:PilW family protein [Gammaproteobacteria bacterium]
MKTDIRTKRLTMLQSPHVQSGFSLVEMMVAVALGLVVTGTVFGVFLSTSRNFALDEQIGRMQENARFAMTTMARDLQMVGFWGRLIGPDSIDYTKTRVCPTPADQCTGIATDTTLALDVDCQSNNNPPDTSSNFDTWAYDVRAPIQALPEATSSEANTEFQCIATSEFMDVTGNQSDVLAIKSVQGVGRERAVQSVTERKADDGRVFLRTNGVKGAIIEYDADHTVTGNPGSDVLDWKYVNHVYYIRNFSVTAGDGIPSLFRKHLFAECTTFDPNPPNDCIDFDHNMQTEAGGVAEGIEYFHVIFGIDSDNDGVANFYEAEPTATDLSGLVTAKIYVLARSPDADWAYTNDKTYTLGDVIRGPFNDNFHRRVFSSTVVLRNPANLNALSNLGN